MDGIGELSGLELIEVISKGRKRSASEDEWTNAGEAVGALRSRLEDLRDDYAARRDVDRAIRGLVGSAE